MTDKSFVKAIKGGMKGAAKWKSKLKHSFKRDPAERRPQHKEQKCSTTLEDREPVAHLKFNVFLNGSTFLSSFLTGKKCTTMGTAWALVQCVVDGKLVEINFWSSLAKENYTSSMYFNNSDGVMFVCSANEFESFSRLQDSMRSMNGAAAGLPAVILLDYAHIPRTEWAIREEELSGVSMEAEFLPWIAVSSLTGSNVDHAVETLVRAVLCHKQLRLNSLHASSSNSDEQDAPVFEPPNDNHKLQS